MSESREPSYVIFELKDETLNTYVPTWVVAEDEDEAVDTFLKHYGGPADRKWQPKKMVVAPIKACSDYTVTPTFDVDAEPWKP